MTDKSANKKENNVRCRYTNRKLTFSKYVTTYSNYKFVTSIEEVVFGTLSCIHPRHNSPSVVLPRWHNNPQYSYALRLKRFIVFNALNMEKIKDRK